MQPPPEIEKGAATNDAPDSPLSQKTAYPRVYRCDSKSASHKPLRLIHSDELKGRVLKKAAQQVRQEPQTLPLWALRLAQHVNRGTFGYREAWDVLERAAFVGGASQAWAGRVLYRGFADSITMDADPMPLTVLVGGVQ